jgi:hypothetical protein
MKFKLLYKQGHYEMAKEIYDQMRCLYTVTKQTKVLEELDKSVDEDYPRIFQTIGTNINTDAAEGMELDMKEEPGKDSNESNRKS